MTKGDNALLLSTAKGDNALLLSEVKGDNALADSTDNSLTLVESCNFYVHACI